MICMSSLSKVGVPEESGTGPRTGRENTGIPARSLSNRCNSGSRPTENQNIDGISPWQSEPLLMWPSTLLTTTMDTELPAWYTPTAWQASQSQWGSPGPEVRTSHICTVCGHSLYCVPGPANPMVNLSVIPQQQAGVERWCGWWTCETWQLPCQSPI